MMIFRILLGLAGLAILGVSLPMVIGGFDLGTQMLRDTLPLGPTDISAGRDTDSEIRFLAVLLTGFGSAALWLGYSFPRHHQIIPLLLGTFALGGLARLIAWAQHGRPGDLTLLLMGMEILPALLLVVLYVKLRQQLRQ